LSDVEIDKKTLLLLLIIYWDYIVNLSFRR